VLVAGLGLGFTLRAVLADPRVEQVTVVELEPALVEWLRSGLVPGGAAALEDPRVSVLVADVADAVAAAGSDEYDLHFSTSTTVPTSWFTRRTPTSTGCRSCAPAGECSTEAVPSWSGR
jgi:spermidine synthase